MSEILDKIRIIQEKTGCSVIKGKELYDLAGGDIDLAVAIFEEENAGSVTPEVKEPVIEQPQEQKESEVVEPTPAPVEQEQHQEQIIKIEEEKKEVSHEDHAVAQTLEGVSLNRPIAEPLSIPRPNDPGPQIATPKQQQYAPMGQPSVLNIPHPSGQRILNVNNAPKQERNYQPEPEALNIPRTDSQKLVNNEVRTYQYNAPTSQPMPTVIPRPYVQGQVLPAEQANPNRNVSNINVPRPERPGEHLARSQQNNYQGPVPLVIPRPSQPQYNEPIVQNQNIQPARPVGQNQQVVGQPVVLGSLPRNNNIQQNYPSQPKSRFTIEKPDQPQYFHSSFNDTNNQPTANTISIPQPHKQETHVVSNEFDNQPKNVQMPTPQTTGPNSHFVMAKPTNIGNNPTPVVISSGGIQQNNLQSNQIQQAPQPSGSNSYVMKLPSRPGSRSVIGVQENGEDKEEK